MRRHPIINHLFRQKTTRLIFHFLWQDPDGGDLYAIAQLHIRDFSWRGTVDDFKRGFQMP